MRYFGGACVGVGIPPNTNTRSSEFPLSLHLKYHKCNAAARTPLHFPLPRPRHLVPPPLHRRRPS
jgi:hypothetical protein